MENRKEMKGKMPLAALVIASAKKKGNDMGGEEEYDAGKEAGGQELLDAIANKDPRAVAEAIRSLVEMCNADMEME